MCRKVRPAVLAEQLAEALAAVAAPVLVVRFLVVGRFVFFLGLLGRRFVDVEEAIETAAAVPAGGGGGGAAAGGATEAEADADEEPAEEAEEEDEAADDEEADDDDGGGDGGEGLGELFG